MNTDELKKEFLMWLRHQLERGENLASQEVPLVLQEFVQYSMIHHGLSLFFGLLSLITALVLIFICSKQLRDQREYDITALTGTGAAFSLILGILLVSLHFSPFLGAWLTPRGYLLEKFLL